MSTFFFYKHHLPDAFRLRRFVWQLYHDRHAICGIRMLIEVRSKLWQKNLKDMEIHEYSNGRLTFLWKPKLCIHSAICVRALPNVYDPKVRPWIRPENATGDELIAQIAKCPSGALSIKGGTK